MQLIQFQLTMQIKVKYGWQIAVKNFLIRGAKHSNRQGGTQKWIMVLNAGPNVGAQAENQTQVEATSSASNQ